MDPVQEVYNHWMKYRAPKNGWKGCALEDGEPLAHVKNAIRARLKDCNGRVDVVKRAIDNYAKLLLGSEYTWKYAWTLHQFLTRKRKDSNGELQFHRFIDIEPRDFLTKKAKAARLNRAKQEQAAADRVAVIERQTDPLVMFWNGPIEDVRETYRTGSQFERSMIRKHRPEAVI